jgi:4a-hydroxytetrahydrobiopterin dehydratase
MDSIDVTLYTRQDCPLCEKAKGAMRAAMTLHRLPVTLHEIDVDLDPDLQARFTNDVPVVYVNGREAFRHHVDVGDFTNYIRGEQAPSSSAIEPIRPRQALSSEKCVPCRGGVPPLTPAEREPLLAELDPAWRVVDGHHLAREFTFTDFAAALAFTNRVGALAEEEGHHPDIYLAWGKVRIEIWTHKIDGLTRSDFVLAAKTDRLDGATSNPSR